MTAAFTEAAQDADIESGETLAALFGKIKKRFSALAQGLAERYTRRESDARYAAAAHTHAPASIGAATAAQGAKADAAMPKSGGTFTGNAVAVSTNRVGDVLRNAKVVNAAWTAAPATNMIVFQQK